ncbi:MAG: lactate utilization protein C [Cytophagaceae bacterium]
MSSKSKILASVIKNKPNFSASLPELNDYSENEKGDIQQFKEACIKAGSSLVEVQSIKEISNWFPAVFNDHIRYFSNIPGISSSVNIDEMQSLSELQYLQVAILTGEFAVAENGAVWVSGNTLPLRIIPVIVESLMLVVKKEKIVANMHKAIKKISMNTSSYGVFIAGPSKTADIEQSLVIGAHGPKRLDIILI